MSSVLQASPRVHSKFEVLPDRDPTPPEDDGVEPFMSPEDCGFIPSATQEAWWIAFNAALAGDDPEFPVVSLLIRREVYNAHAAGKRAGKRAREVQEARELGFELGYTTGISEPPTGFSPAEKAAYREGFAAGEREFREDSEFEAWVAHEEAERLHDALGVEIQDCDVWPMDCMS